MHRRDANRVRFLDGLLAFGGIDDEADLVVLDHVDDVRSTFAYLVDPPAPDAAVGQRPSRTARGHDLESPLVEDQAQRDRGGLSVSLTLISAVPWRGSETPEADCALA